MGTVPAGLASEKKAADENTDAIVNATAKAAAKPRAQRTAKAAAKPRAQRTAKEQKTIETQIEKADTTDEKAKVTTGSPAEGEVLPKAEPEATSDPTEPVVAPEKDDETAVQNQGPEEEFSVTPEFGGPNALVTEGQVEVRKAEPGAVSDPGGNVTEVRKQGTQRAPKKDPLKNIAHDAVLPVAAAVGQVVGVVEKYAGNAVLSLSLKGWVGEAPLKILASDVGEIEQVLAELRKELS